MKSLTNNDKNDNIIEYYGYYEENGYLNIIMEYGGDKNLGEFINLHVDYLTVNNIDSLVHSLNNTSHNALKSRFS